MLQRLIGPILTAAGAMILAASLLANVIGRFGIGRSLGVGQDPGFGSQQALGTIIGLGVLVVGVWLWRRGGEAKYRSARYAVAASAFAVVIGGPLYVVANRVLLPSAAVEACVEVEAVPRSAGGVGQKRVNYGVGIANTGRSNIYVDSVVLMAYRDSAGSLLTQSEVVEMGDMVLWKQVDSETIRAGNPEGWSLPSGAERPLMRSVIVPVEQLSPLYWFGGSVFFRHRDPGRPIVRRAINWIDSFRQECP
ncbi:MAG: hypothetical protein P8Y10_08515 [Gemmatimonadales bacterium]